MADSKAIAAPKPPVSLSFKVSKKFWLVLGIGILAVLAAALWFLRNQQIAEQKRLNDELAVANSRLATMEFDKLAAQRTQLQDQMAAVNAQTQAIYAKIGIPTDSIAVSDALYAIATKSGVVITDIRATEEQVTEFAGIPCHSIALTVTAEGPWSKLNDFVSNMKTDFITCLVETAAFSGNGGDAAETPSVKINMTVYTLEGKQP